MTKINIISLKDFVKQYDCLISEDALIFLNTHLEKIVEVVPTDILLTNRGFKKSISLFPTNWTIQNRNVISMINSLLFLSCDKVKEKGRTLITKEIIESCFSLYI